LTVRQVKYSHAYLTSEPVDCRRPYDALLQLNNLSVEI